MAERIVSYNNAPIKDDIMKKIYKVQIFFRDTLEGF